MCELHLEMLAMSKQPAFNHAFANSGDDGLIVDRFDS